MNKRHIIYTSGTIATLSFIEWDSHAVLASYIFPYYFLNHITTSINNDDEHDYKQLSIRALDSRE